MTLTPRQLSALEITIATAWEGKPKPKRSSEAELIHKDAKAALEALKATVKA